MHPIDVLKLETKVLNFSRSKEDRVAVNSLSKQWVAMEDADRAAFDAKLNDADYMKNLLLQAKNKKADPAFLSKYGLSVESPSEKQQQEPAPKKEQQPPK